VNGPARTTIGAAGGKAKSAKESQAPEGASDFEGLTASLKRCPDTKPKFLRSLLAPLSADFCSTVPRQAVRQNADWALEVACIASFFGHCLG